MNKDIKDESGELIGKFDKVYEHNGVMYGDLNLHDPQVIDHIINNSKPEIGGYLDKLGNFKMTHIALVPKK